MSKFKKSSGKGLQKINTSSLPDIVFMLLFFFMVATTMRETEVQVRVRVPEATEVKKLEKKSEVGKDEMADGLDSMQALTDKHGKEIDDVVSAKEKEVMTV